jgi:hypothetical protein
LNRRVIDGVMKTANAAFGHWATAMPPVRRLTNIHRTIRRSFEEPLLCAIASSGVVTVTPARLGHSQCGAVSPAGDETVSATASVRRTGLDSIPESTLETNGWLDFEHGHEKALGRRD